MKKGKPMYCTLADLKKKIPESILIRLTDEKRTGAVDTDKTDEAIAEAVREIDFFLGQIYQLPLEDVPPILKSLAADVALYHLYSISVEEFPETRKDRYKEALAKLRDAVKRGTLGEGQDVLPDPVEDAGSGIEVAASNPLFDDNTLSRF